MSGRETPKQHRFQPGVSGNPSGKPGGTAEFRQLCRDNAPMALKRLLLSVSKGNIRAIELLFAYAYGKPTQTVTGEDGGPIKMTFRWAGDDEGPKADGP